MIHESLVECHWHSYHTLTSVITFSYWRDAHQHGIYLFFYNKVLYRKQLAKIGNPLGNHSSQLWFLLAIAIQTVIVWGLEGNVLVISAPVSRFRALYSRLGPMVLLYWVVHTCKYFAFHFLCLKNGQVCRVPFTLHPDKLDLSSRESTV